MIRSIHAALFVAVMSGPAQVLAQTAVLAPPEYGSLYPDLKLWHERALSISPSPQERLEHLRTLVRSKMGQQGLDRLFNNFQGRGAIDPAIPGVEKNVRLCVSDNPNVARGARRTQLYATRIYNDPRFKLLAIDEPTSTPLGRTDKDIRFRHRATGTEGRIEVKEWTEATQRSNRPKIEKQIRKMAASAHATGEKQALIFRKGVIPEIRDYARRYGIPVYDSVATGEKTKLASGATPVESVLDDLDHQIRVATRLRVLRAGASVGFGLLTAITSGRTALAEYQLVRRGYGSWKRFGHHASITVSGIGLTVAGGAEVASLLASGSRWAGRLTRISSGGRVLAAFAFLAAEGFLFWEWRAGEISTREFALSQGLLVGGLVGGLGGAWVGATLGAGIGSFFPGPGTAIGAAIGGILGGIGGALVGSRAGESAVNMWYEFRDAQQHQKFRDYVYKYFGAYISGEGATD